MELEERDNQFGIFAVYLRRSSISEGLREAVAVNELE